jgi:hypothetical protein
VTSQSAAGDAPASFFAPRALVRLCLQSQRELWGLRLSRLYGIGIGVSYALLAWLGHASIAGAAKLWAHTLATASWVAGAGALSLATDLKARDAARGFTSLARLRGHGDSELERARLLAGVQQLFRAVLVPGLIVALALSLRFHTLRGSLVALALAVMTLPYAALVAGVLGPLARGCSCWLPGRGRFLLLSLTLGPYLLGIGLRCHVPSIPGAFAWLLHHVAGSFR